MNIEPAPFVDGALDHGFGLAALRTSTAKASRGADVAEVGRHGPWRRRVDVGDEYPGAIGRQDGQRSHHRCRAPRPSRSQPCLPAVRHVIVLVFASVLFNTACCMSDPGASGNLPPENQPENQSEYPVRSRSEDQAAIRAPANRQARPACARPGTRKQSVARPSQ